jgi:hypothetical protein
MERMTAIEIGGKKIMDTSNLKVKVKSNDGKTSVKDAKRHRLVFHPHFLFFSPPGTNVITPPLLKL